MQNELPWSHEIDVASVPAEGTTLDLMPDEIVRGKLAEVADVIAVPALRVKLEIRSTGVGEATVTGRLEGVVRQTCVVSLEEFENPVEENFEVEFSANPESSAKDAGAEEGLGADDLPDPIIDGKIDLGALATEFLMLGIDPYPRKPGVAFEGGASEQQAPAPKQSPFGKLAGLKDSLKK